MRLGVGWWQCLSTRLPAPAWKTLVEWETELSPKEHYAYVSVPSGPQVPGRQRLSCPSPYSQELFFGKWPLTALVAKFSWTRAVSLHWLNEGLGEREWCMVLSPRPRGRGVLVRTLSRWGWFKKMPVSLMSIEPDSDAFDSSRWKASSQAWEDSPGLADPSCVHSWLGQWLGLVHSQFARCLLSTQGAARTKALCREGGGRLEEQRGMLWERLWPCHHLVCPCENLLSLCFL
jgi:hypothetical protein